MKAFLISLGKLSLGAALNGAASATNSGADLKTVGVTAGVTALAAVLQSLLSHPASQHPVTVAAVAAQLPA